MLNHIRFVNCSLGHVTKFLLRIFYIMGYNSKDCQKWKEHIKIPKWPSLKPLPLKSKFIQQFEFSENLEDICVARPWSNLFNFLKT